MSEKKYAHVRLSIEEGSKRKKINELLENRLSPFFKKDMKDVFIYAMGIGFQNGKRTRLRKKVASIPWSAFTDEQTALIKTIGISDENNIDVLIRENVKKMFDVAEEYANGGIDKLYYRIFGDDEKADANYKLEQDLRELMKQSSVEHKSVEQKTGREYELLKEFENEMRLFIQRTLQNKYGESWWKTRIPKDVREACDEKMKSRDNIPGIDKKETEPIDYMDFTDYSRVILKRDHWREVFSKFFIDDAWIKTRLMYDIKPIRNDLAHNREVKNEDIDKLKLATTEILRCIRKKKK